MEEKRVVYDATLEKRILTAMIVSTEYLRKMRALIRSEWFSSKYAEIISIAVLEFYDLYKEAPNKHIQELFERAASLMQQDDVELFSKLLQSLNDEYDGNGINVGFIIDESKEFFNKRGLYKTAEKVQTLVMAGRIQEAQKEYEQLRNYQEESTGWSNPLDDTSFIRDAFSAKEPDISLHGKLGQLFGPLEYGWLVSLLGPMKRGKSFLLQEIALQCLLNRKKVVFISLEMDAQRLSKRFYSQITGLPTGYGVSQQITIPILDCKFNKNRVCKDATAGVCFGCRVGMQNRFVPDIVLKEEIRKTQTAKDVAEAVANFRMLTGKNALRLISYPAFSASLADIEASLDTLNFTQGFVPNVIVLDYADIVRPEGKNMSPLEQTDLLWKRLKGMGQERHCLMVTAHQGTRESIKKELITQTDTSQNIKILAHVDLMAGLSQTYFEKQMSCMRVNVVAHRWADFNETRQLLVTQNLAVAQPIVESVFVGSSYKPQEDE